MTASLMTGHTQIDTEHEHLLVLMDQLEESLKANDDEACAGIITELTEALETHLANEEEIMKGHGFPQLEDHKELHQKAKSKYLALIAKAEHHGYANGFSDALISILADDLIAADMDFKTYLESMSYKG